MIYKKTKATEILLPFAIFCCGLLLFTLGIRGQEVIGFESRFYLFAEEMWQHGLSLFPTTYSEPYPDYTALGTILIYFSAKMFGELNKFTALFPQVLFSSLIVVLTYLIGALESKQHGFRATLWLLLTFMFFKSARLISLDIYPAFITTLAFYLVERGKRLNINYDFWVYGCFILGFAVRGPIGLVIPTGVAVMAYLAEKRWRKAMIMGLCSSILLLFCMLILISMAYHAGGKAFVLKVIQMQILGRFEGVFRPFYYYFLNSFAAYSLSYFFALIIMARFLFEVCTKDCSDVVTRKKMLMILKYTLWAGVIYIGMSIPGDKKTRYVLPAAPALALICAGCYENSRFKKVEQWMTGILFTLPILFITALLYFKACRVIGREIDVMRPSIVLGAFMLFNFILYRKFKSLHQLSPMILCSTVLSFICFYFIVIEPIMLTSEQGKAFITTIEKKRAKSQAKLFFYRERKDGIAIKYLIDMPELEKPGFIQKEYDLLTQVDPFFVIMREKVYEHLSIPLKNTFTVVAKNHLGHAKVIVLERKHL